MPLARLGMCVVDLETTGGSPGRSRITEIGAVRLRGLSPVARFSTLVDPGCPIPPVVTRITGIHDAMVAGAPPIGEALARFCAFAGDDVLVAHNAPFDLRFLNYERRRLQGRYFAQPWIDTLALARALLDGRVERHDLATLSAWAGTRVRPAHRALPDAEATAELVGHLLGLAGRRGVATLADIDALLGPAAPAYTPKLALCEDLPARPGVYILRDAAGRPVHLSAASNLRREARRLIMPSGRPSRSAATAVAAAESLDHEVHGSCLGALLRCDELGARLGAPSSRAPAVRYLAAADDGPRGLRLRVAAAPPRGPLEAFGPLRGERRVRRAAEVLRAVYAGGASGRAGASRVRALLAGDPAALAALPRAIRRARAAGRLDPAVPRGRGPVEDLMAVLDQLAMVRRARARVAVLVEEGPREGGAEAFFVAGGRLVARALLEPGDWEDAARAGLARLRACGSAAGPLPPEASEAARLIEERLARRGAHPAAVRLEPGWDPRAAGEAVGRAVAAVCPAGGRDRVAAD